MERIKKYGGVAEEYFYEDGVYNNTEEINLNKLPAKLVIKANHDSGFNVIIIILKI